MKLSCAGLQLQRGVEDITTVEAALEEATFKAGGILESNRGALHKIDWSRSSRTDKGVHSCSTVSSLQHLAFRQHEETLYSKYTRSWQHVPAMRGRNACNLASPSEL